MAAFTDQIQRFEEQWAFQTPLGLRAPQSLPQIPHVKVVQTLHTQILALVLDTSVKERELTCRSAVKALERAERGSDVDSTCLGFLANLPRFSAMRSLTSRNKVSERLGALAAWKWVDLLDEVSNPVPTRGSAAAIDDLLATTSALVFEAMISLGGELTSMADERNDEQIEARKQRISAIAHEAKRLQMAPVKQMLIGHAMQLRESKPNRNEAVRATLRHFQGHADLPKSRTLHEWLKASGWTRASAVD